MTLCALVCFEGVVAPLSPPDARKWPHVKSNAARQILLGAAKRHPTQHAGKRQKAAVRSRQDLTKGEEPGWSERDEKSRARDPPQMHKELSLAVSQSRETPTTPPSTPLIVHLNVEVILGLILGVTLSHEN